MTCEIARNICMVQALAKLGHFPKRESEKEAWFLSPIRQETQASFKVDKNLNRWYDHGIGKGGNSIDLICLMYDCSVKEALKILQSNNYFFSFQQQPILKRKQTGIKIHIIKTTTHPALIKYLITRKIPLEIARLYCKEIWYMFKGRSYFAIGLKNQSGGWELRNIYFKNSSSPKSYTYLKNSGNSLVVLEGMFDLLSLIELDSIDVTTCDIIILNSTAFVKPVVSYFKDYDKVNLLLDNDATGKRISLLLSQNYTHVMDQSLLYKNYKDLNEWLIDGRKI